VAGIGIAYGLMIVGDQSADYITGETNCTNMNDYDACGAEYNASLASADGISKIPAKMPLIATVIVAAVIIGILVRYLMVRFA